jgi:hypothetical protein
MRLYLIAIVIALIGLWISSAVQAHARCEAAFDCTTIVSSYSM